MERKPVSSSQIASMGYDPASKKMHIEFTPRAGAKEGPVYEYDNVEQVDYNEFFEKEPDGSDRSIGRHFGKKIKNDPKRFPYRKLSGK